MVQVVPSTAPDVPARRTTTVLVIDGNEEHLALSVTALGRRGFKVSVSDSSREGVRLALSQPFHAIVLAHKLRDASGLDTLRTLAERLPEVPRIFVVPEGSEDLAVRSLNAGASGYLVKTARYYELLPTEVEEQLAKVKARSRIQDQQKALEETQARYREFVETSRAPIFVIDPTGVFLAFNDAMCSTTGYAMEELQALNLFDMLSPEVQDGSVRRLADLVHGGPAGDLEFALRRKDGREIVVEVTPHLVRRDGEVVGIEVLARDITDRRRAEKELKDLYGWLQAIYEATNDAFLLADRDLRMVQWNSRALDLFRLDAGSMARQTADSLLRALAARTKDSKEVLAGLEAYRADPEHVLEGPFELVTPEPRVYWRLTAPVRSLEGALIGRLWTFRDITDRRRAEDQIRYQANLVENVSDAIIATDAQSRITSWNKAAEAIYGWKAEEVLSKSAFDVLKTEFVHETQEEVWKILLERGSWKGELIESRKDGDHVHILSSASLLRDREGKPVGFVSVNRDITERRAAELALRRRDAIMEAVGFASAQFLKAEHWEDCIQEVLRRLGEAAGVSRVWIFENSTAEDGTIIVDQRYEWCAPGVESQLNNRELKRVPMRDGGFERWEAALSHGDPVYGNTKAFPTQEQRQLFSQEIKSILVVPVFVGAQWWGHIGFDECTQEREWPVSDVEALKAAASTLGTALQRELAQRAIRARVRQQAAVAELGHLALAGTDLPKVFERATALVAATLDVEFSKILELAPDGRTLLLRAGMGWKKGYVGSSSVAAGKDSQAGYTLISGRPVIVKDLRTETRFTGPPLLHEHGVVSGLSVIIPGREQPFGVLGAHTATVRTFTEDDVHFLQAIANSLAAAIERKTSEEDLRLSQERFEMLGRATNDIVWDWDIRRGQVWRSDALYSVLGYSRDEATPSDDWWDAHTHPDDRNRVLENLRKVIGTGARNWTDEYRFRRKDGSYAIIFERGIVLHDEAGKPIRMIGSVMDVTKRRHAERVQAATYRISEAASSAKDLDELYRSIHTIVGELMPADNFYIALYDSKEETISFPFFVDQYEPPPPPQKLGRGLTEYVLRTGIPVLASPSVFEELVRDGEVESVGPPSIDWLGVPLIANGKTIGALVTQSYTQGVRYGEQEKEILAFVCTQVAMAIDRKRSEEAVRESESRYRLLFESNPAPMLVYDFETLKILAVNAAAVRHYGYSQEEFLSMTIKELRLPEDVPALLEFVKKLTPGFSASSGWRHRKKDGTTIEVEIISHGIPFGGRDARLVLVNDVTEKKRAQEAIQAAEAKFRGLVEQALVGNYIIQDGRFAYVNPKLAEIFGYSQEEIIGSKAVEDLVLPEDRTRVSENLRRRIDGEMQSLQYVFRGRRKDGSVIDCEVHGTKMMYNGRPAVIGSLLDITERKRAEDELRRSERKFRTLFEAAAEGILLIDRQANLLDINPAGEVVVGGQRADLIGRNLKDFLLPEDLERARQYLRDVIHGRSTPDPFEIIVSTVEGHRKSLEVRSRAVREAGAEPYVEMAIRDVTIEKEMQRRLVQSERLASVGKLSAYLAHEINTPLTNISLLTASVSRRTQDAELLDKLEKINVQRRMATNIISDLLKFAKQREINPMETDLRELVEVALEQVESHRRPEVSIVRRLGDQPVKANVDPLQIQEVFVNLVKNAYEATTKGSVTVTLEVRPDAVVFVVADTGSGMTPEVQAHLFEPFYTTKKFGEGTGLGLPMCQNIIVAHGGRIDVASTSGEGSTFTVFLSRGEGS